MSDRKTRRPNMAVAAARRITPDAPVPGQTAVRVKPVRITVDLTPADYRQLREWAESAAADLDLPKLAIADVVRAMITVVSVDSGIGAEVRERIRQARA